MTLIYILLILITIGVLLITEVGKQLLGFIGIMLFIIAAIYSAWVVINWVYRKHKEHRQRKSTIIGITELLKNSWKIYKEKFKVFLGIMIVPILIYLLIGFFSLFANKSPLFFSILILIGFLVSITIGFWASLALIFVIKDRKENIGTKESFKRSKKVLISFAWISLLTGIILVGGFLLLIIPGILFAIWFLFAPYVFVVEGKKGMKAIFGSKDLVKGKEISVFFRIISIFIILIIIFAPINYFLKSFSFIKGIISLLISPLFTIYYFLLYEDLKRVKNSLIAENK